MRVPDDLSEIDQWGLWRSERRNGEDTKDTKVPYNAISGRLASSTDPQTWCSYEEAATELARHPERWSGLAWFFHESDQLAGIDLDNCLNSEGLPKAWARGIVERFFDTYAETSPSGQGIKIWCKGKLPQNMGKVMVGDGGIEMYDRARFFAVTARVFRNAPLQIEDHAADVLLLYEKLTADTRGWNAEPKPDGVIPYGQQHLTLVSIAGTLRRRRLCDEAILACLMAVNRNQCERPGPPENIERIVRSTRRWA